MGASKVSNLFSPLIFDQYPTLFVPQFKKEIKSSSADFKTDKLLKLIVSQGLSRWGECFIEESSVQLIPLMLH